MGGLLEGSDEADDIMRMTLRERWPLKRAASLTACGS